MKQLFLLFTFLFIGSKMVFSQIGGNHTFAYVNIENSARHAALGGIIINQRDHNPALGYQNPALINKDMHQNISLTYANYLADLNHGFASYAHHFDKAGTFLFSIGFLDYGNFDKRDVTGFGIGEFRVTDYTFQVGYTKPLSEKWSMGSNLKFLYSAHEAFVSTGMAADLGTFYEDTSKLFTFGGVIKNAGVQILTFNNDGNRQPLPFDMQIAVSKKLRYNPMRFTAIVHHLHKWDLSYVNVNTRNKQIDLETNEIINQRVGFGHKLFLHTAFNAELIFSKNFQLRLGYNQLRRAQLSPEERRALTGFSYGFCLGIKTFTVSYGSAGFYPGIASHNFSIVKNLSELRNKNKNLLLD
jgi:hypothetical protein